MDLPVGCFNLRTYTGNSEFIKKWNKLLRQSSRGQSAIGLKQTPKPRPAIFGTAAAEKSTGQEKEKSLDAKALSLAEMFERAGTGYVKQIVNFTEPESLFYENGKLISGSLEALIQHLVPSSDYYPDRTYVFAFLLSSRLFIKPHVLLGKLCQACKLHQSLTDLRIKRDSLGKFGPHIVRLLSEWTEMFPYDFRDEIVMKQLKEITQKILPFYPDIRSEVGNMMHNLIIKLSSLQKSEEYIARLNEEILHKSQTQIVPNTDVIEICPSPLRMAQQLTVIELERLCTIGPEEFVQSFAKETIETEVPVCDIKKTSNLESYIHWFNRLSFLIATEICSHLKKKTRARLIEYFMDVAKECINIGNFNSVMAIIAGLVMSPVARLKKTWAKVNTIKFDILEHQMDPSSNFGSYRSCLKAAIWRSQGAEDDREKVVIPFFTLLVKDIYFLNEGCSSRLANGNVNFEKFWQLAKQISEFVSWQQVNSPYEKDESIVEYLLTTPVFSETTLSLASFECEQAETSMDKSRHKELKTQSLEKQSKKSGYHSS